MGTIKSNKLTFGVLVLILIAAAFFRLFRLHQLLGFWYDQGRDALVIWDLLHNEKFFLIGPVTGIEGIFLGPFYYYLLAVFYWLGNSSPVFAAAGLAWLTIGAIFLIYVLAAKIYNRKVGLVAAFLYGFSYSLVVFSRWLANPNPLPFFTMLVLLSFYFFLQGRRIFLVLGAFFIGLCLQLEAASAFWFLPATLVILIWQRKKLNLKVLSLSFLALFITLLPQIVFDLRHQGILRSAFQRFLIAEKSFAGFEIKRKLLLYYDVFCGKLFPGNNFLMAVSLALFSAGLVVFKKKIFTDGGKLLIIWLFIPLLGFFLYKGNHGYVWDYYFTGFIPVFIILMAMILVQLFERNLGFKILVMVFLFLFFVNNINPLSNYFKTGIGITLRSQLWAIDWIYRDADDQEFNVDVYVPPQISYSYSYLFKWYGREKHGREPQTGLVKTLYTLYEPDGNHPEFLNKWLKRQETIGKILKSEEWGDITVQERERIKYE